MIDRFFVWLWRDVKAAREEGYRRGLMDAAKIVRAEHFQLSHDGKAMITILNELLELVAVRLDEEARK